MRADNIFQHEQEMIMQAAQDMTKPKKPQLYIDENGYALCHNVSLRALMVLLVAGSLPRADRLVQVPRCTTLPHK